MKAGDKSAIDRRLARIEGQVRGLRRLVDEDVYCCDVLNQVSAVRSALDQVAASIVAQHVRHCIVDSHGDGAHPHAKGMTREELLDELGEVMGRLMR